jgi:hypothetical protein
MRKRTFADALRFIFSPVDNPFFAVMWRQQRRNMGQFFLHLGMILGFVWLAFTAAGLLMERFNFSFQTRAIALYEITALAHLFAAEIYGVTVYRRYRQFWRRDTLPQLLLTGAPPILIVLAIPVYLLFIQAYIALLCLPFYAATSNLSGIPWSTVLLDASIIALLASLPGSMGTFLWWLLFQLSIRTAPFPYSLAVWSQLPLLLTLPVRFFAWSVPTWLLVVVGILLLSVISFTSWAWFLEPRFYPSQVRVLWWAHRAWLLAAVFICGLMWAYWFPSDFAAKVAFSLVLIRLLFSVEFLSLASTRSDEAPRTPTRWADAEVLVANGLMLSVCGLVGWAEGLAISKIAPVLAIGGLLGILHYIAHSLSANWWRKVMVAQRMPLTWWLAFSVWLIAPLALLIPPISPLAGFHGWLLPLTLMPTSLQQQISTSWFHGIRISLPHWSLMAIVQIAWAGLLWALERMSKLPQVQPEEKRREWLTVNHPLWGWLARLEEQLCKRFANPLVTLQLRQQSRDKVLHATMTIGVIANLLVLSIWLLSRIFPQQDFVAFTEELLIRLPSLAGLAGTFSALVVNTSHEQKSALWLLGRKRVVESFVLAPLTADQWNFGWWFPRFWLCLKATMPYALCAWLGLALRPSLGFALVAILVTASLPVTALAWALAGLSVSMMRQWEAILALISMLPIVGGVWNACFLATLISKGWHLHALVWLLWFIFSAILAVSCMVIVSKRIGLLRTPSGYEQWLKLTEEKFRRARS